MHGWMDGCMVECMGALIAGYMDRFLLDVR